MKTALVIGGGIAGTTISYLLSENGWKVTLVEKAPFLGGGFKTFYHGGHPYTLGPRPLLARNEAETGIFKFVNELVPLRRLDHSLLTYVEKDGQFYTYPIHEDDVGRMPEAEQIRSELKDLQNNSPAEPKDFEEFWSARVGATLYDKFIDNYSRKMWQLNSNKEMKEFRWSPKGHALKSGSRFISTENIWAGYPIAYDGYDQYFVNTTRKVDVRLGAEPEAYDLERKRLRVKGEWLSADIIVNTASIDDIFGQCYGALPYIGRDFIKLVLPIERVFPDAVQFIHYAGKETFTRVVEYKSMTFYQAPTTLLVLETPSANGRLYPLPLPEPKALAKRYLDDLPPDVFTMGRLGLYMYNIDMEGIILQARDLVEKLN